MEILFTDKALLTRGGVVGESHFTVKKNQLIYIYFIIVQILPFLAWASTSYTCSAWGAGVTVEL